MGSQNSKIKRIEIQTSLILKDCPLTSEKEISAYGTIIDTEMNLRDSSKGSQRTMNVGKKALKIHKSSTYGNVILKI